MTLIFALSMLCKGMQNHRKIQLAPGLAPMEGVTILPMRLWFALVSSPATMGTPFLRVTDTFPLEQLPTQFAPELFALKSYIPYRLIPQLMSVEVEHFARTAELFRGASDVLELNCGCPSPICVGKGAGSSMLRDPDTFHQSISALSERLGAGRFAVKMRVGFDSSAEFTQLLRGIKDLPLSRLTVHGRTRVDGYGGSARWDLIQQAAVASCAPVIASGDVVDRASYVAKLCAAPDVSGVVIGRGALRQPWIFSEIRTNKAIILTGDVLVHALAVMAMLHELNLRDLDDAGERLPALVQEGLLSKTPMSALEQWQYCFSKVREALSEQKGRQIYDIEVRHVVVSRTKMLWNYLRTSLPEVFFAPVLMRSKTLGELLTGIAACARICQQETGADSLPLAHAAMYDRLFSGARRELSNVVQSPLMLPML